MPAKLELSLGDDTVLDNIFLETESLRLDIWQYEGKIHVAYRRRTLVLDSGHEIRIKNETTSIEET